LTKPILEHLKPPLAQTLPEYVFQHSTLILEHQGTFACT
jgi:hypothetical protein